MQEARWLKATWPCHLLPLMENLVPGLSAEADEIVTDQLTAAVYGSGLVAAFATPALVALVENAAFNAVRPFLEEGQTTVGVEVNIKHLAATPTGMRVRARAELVQFNGRRLDFKVEAWDDVEKIGEGTHARMIVDNARFHARFDQKKAQVKG